MTDDPAQTERWLLQCGCLGLHMDMGDQIPFPSSGGDHSRGMKSNNLFCSARPATGATEKGQPGSHLAWAAWALTELWHEALTVGWCEHWSSHPAQSWMHTQHCSTKAPMSLVPPEGSPPRGVAVLMWAVGSSSSSHWVNPKQPRPKGTSESGFRREDPAVLTAFSQSALGISPKKHWQLRGKAITFGLLKSKVLSLFLKGFSRPFAKA